MSQWGVPVSGPYSVVPDHGGLPFLLTAGVPLGQEGECRFCPAWTVLPRREGQRAPLTLTLIEKKSVPLFGNTKNDSS